MSFAAAINARRSMGGHGGSEEETRPLNPNRDDYEDIENPSEVSKLDKAFFVQDCLFMTTFVVIMVIICMLSIHFMNAIVQWMEVPGPCTVLPGGDKSSISKLCF